MAGSVKGMFKLSKTQAEAEAEKERKETRNGTYHYLGVDHGTNSEGDPSITVTRCSGENSVIREPYPGVHVVLDMDGRVLRVIVVAEET